MKLKTLGLLVAACALLHGCFFFVIPIGAISDAMTGAHGSNCVAASVQVGDTVRFPDGTLGMVTSLSGTSSRCTDSQHPIRAEVGSANVNASTPVRGQERLEAENAHQHQIQQYAVNNLRGCLHGDSPLAMEVTCIHSTFLSTSAPDALSAIQPIEERAQELLREARSNAISEVEAQRQLSASVADWDGSAPH
jgi:hypothetical protein